MHPCLFQTCRKSTIIWKTQLDTLNKEKWSHLFLIYMVSSRRRQIFYLLSFFPSSYWVLFLLTAFKKHVIYEETRSERHSLHLHIKVKRELDPKVIWVCEGLFHTPRPLLGDLANSGLFIKRFDLQMKNENISICRMHMANVLSKLE